MSDIRVGQLGRIVAGRQVGRVVEVLDDTAKTGGFFIFTYADVDRSPEIFDGWVLSWADIDTFFAIREWQIEWIDEQ